MTYRGKRALDLSVALPLAVCTLPLQAVAAGAIRVTMGAPVLFRQERPGLHGETFILIKFRTMRAATGPTDLGQDEARLTRLGRLLRSTSIDELPSLWNVLRGDMSLVGPRPLLVQYLDRYSPDQARRHCVRPGLTGLAQVSGRNALDWDEKFRLDVVYVKTASLRTDLQILLQSLRAVVGREGISAAGAATMPEFLGSATDFGAPG